MNHVYFHGVLHAIDKIVCLRGSIPWLSYCKQRKVSIGGPNKADNWLGGLHMLFCHFI